VAVMLEVFMVDSLNGQIDGGRFTDLRLGQLRRQDKGTARKHDLGEQLCLLVRGRP
jgi:hypothetical protein